ncbi:4-hydroxyphenylpyruvate dioxygenase-like protein, partial [Stegodyphus mimosarum]
MQPVVHHVEMCVRDGRHTLASLKHYGFRLHAQRVTPFCKQWVIKLGEVFFIITERQKNYVKHSIWNENTVRAEPWTVLCCESQSAHEVDTVFNVSFCVKNVKNVTGRVRSLGASVIQPPTSVKDEKNGHVSYSIVRSCCGNVVHTLINKDDYTGSFLPGFETVDTIIEDSSETTGVTHIDHVTLACSPGHSSSIISWYESCFGMQRFSISRNDDNDEGLILADGVGLRLKAMEYWMCSEIGLMYPVSSKHRQRNSNGVMLVVVESLPGQTNCNVETYLREHEGPGVEHVALNTPKIVETVSKMISLGVKFRQPPAAYYNELKKVREIQEIGEDLTELEKLGILLDNEVEPGKIKEKDGSPKYLMQIFAHPLFSRKTFFIEVIERSGARGLGSGNIIALVRSVREEEKRKMAEAKQKTMNEEDISSPRRLC